MTKSELDQYLIVRYVARKLAKLTAHLTTQTSDEALLACGKILAYADTLQEIGSITLSHYVRITEVVVQRHKQCLNSPRILKPFVPTPV